MVKAKTSSRDITLAHPDLQRLFRELKEWWTVNGDGSRMIVTQTTRACDLQELYYQQGKSKARCGQSLHNYEPSLAIDIAFARSNGTLNWNKKLFAKAGKEAERMGFVWGGSWKSFYDGVHFQLPMTWQQAKAGEIVKVYQNSNSVQEKAILSLLDLCIKAMQSIKNLIQK